MIVKLWCIFVYYWCIELFGSWLKVSLYYIFIVEKGRYNVIINIDNCLFRIKKVLCFFVRIINFFRCGVFSRIFFWCCKIVDIFIIKELWSDW